MLQDLIIIIGIIFFVYKLITHEGKLSLARIVAMLGMSIWLGVGFSCYGDFFNRNVLYTS